MTSPGTGVSVLSQARLVFGPWALLQWGIVELPCSVLRKLQIILLDEFPNRSSVPLCVSFLSMLQRTPRLCTTQSSTFHPNHSVPV